MNFGKLIGLHIDETADGRCLAHLEVTEALHNPHGVVHGGVPYALADTAMGAALYPLLKPGETCATIEMKMNYLRPMSSGRLDCESTVVRRGRTTAVLEARLRNGAGDVAIALSTYAIYPRPE